MPLELGMAVACRFQGRITGIQHNWVALVPQGFVHQKFISDLAGFDAPAHEQTAASIIREVAAWLTQQPDFTPPAPSARKILEALPELERLLAEERDEGLDHLTWPTIVRCAQIVVAAMGEPAV